MAIFRENKSDEDKILTKNGKDKSNKNNVPDYLKRFLIDLKKTSKSKQLITGAIGGIASGYLSAKFGKLAAIAIGGSLLVIQIAQYNGYIEIDWKKLNQDVEVIKKQMDKNKSHLPVAVNNIKQFISENAVLASGFASGFLIGFAWA